jgi:hypothetical protein
MYVCPIVLYLFNSHSLAQGMYTKQAFVLAAMHCALGGRLSFMQRQEGIKTRTSPGWKEKEKVLLLETGWLKFLDQLKNRYLTAEVKKQDNYNVLVDGVGELIKYLERIRLAYFFNEKV